MNAGRYVLSRILDLVHWQTLTRLAAKYEPDSTEGALPKGIEGGTIGALSKA